MDDASGHYTTGYLWGNNYWMGSMALCKSIYLEDVTKFDKKPSSNTGLTTNNDNKPSSQLAHENPPFFPRFGVLKIGLVEPQTTPNVSSYRCRLPIVVTNLFYHRAEQFTSVFVCRLLAIKRTSESWQSQEEVNSAQKTLRS